MNEQNYQLALAGLLHDVGKVMLRAAESGTRTWDDEARGDFKYKHAMLTASFIERYVPKSWRQKVKLWAGDHHNPQSREDEIIALADWLSAAERDDGILDEDVRKDHPKQLYSIFTSIFAGRAGIPTEWDNAYLPLAPLEMKEETIFPGPEMTDEAVWQHYYNNLWFPFTVKADELRKAYETEGDLASYLESMLLLMQRYMWSVPAAYYNTRPDISLYDHGRMTAALAVALNDLAEEDVKTLREKPKTEKEVALLVGGDLSGMQDFLYTITNKGATHALRGRSFYLQLLTEAIARYVLRKLELPITNLIYQGGGNFYILARASDAARLASIQQEISRALLKHHRGELYVALAGVPLQAADFFDGKLSGKWGELAETQQTMKLRRFAELEAEELRQLFQPLDHGGNDDKQCQVCGREHPGTTPDKESEVRKCPQCVSYEKLGKDLRKARYLVLEHVPATKHAAGWDEPPGEMEEVLRSFGMKAELLDSDSKISNLHTDHPLTILAIKDDAVRKLEPGPRQAVGRRFLVNVTPILQEEEYKKYKDEIEESYQRNKRNQWPEPIKPFSVLAAQATGIKRLGVLRMDVDDMGKLFAEGLGQRATLSRVAGLSFAVSLFFEGWVEHLAEERQRPSEKGDKNRLYSIYSGGDDLFFVGSWDAVVAFAQQVRADLERYAAKHPAIHASGGIVLVSGKYPLAQAARDAGEAEHAAKHYQRWDKKQQKMVTAKDAISFLGQVQPWQRFGTEWKQGMDTVSGLAYILVDMTKQKNNGRSAPKSLLRNLSRLYAQYATAERQRAEVGEDETLKGEPQPLWGPWMWQGFYMLKRADNEKVKSLADTLHNDEFRSMTWMGLATRWAELLIR